MHWNLLTMTDQHPTITPPPELRQLWAQQAQRISPHDPVEWMQYVSEKAAQWGADIELEACCSFLEKEYPFQFEGKWECIRASDDLRAARRPKPQTLSSIALQTLDTIERDAHYLPEITDTIRRAILRLKQLEDSND